MTHGNLDPSARIFAILMALVASAAASPALAASDECQGRETLQLVNGRIHTLDARDTVVSNVLIKGSTFSSVGPGGDHSAGRCTRVIDLGGRTAVPGIIDNHNHILLLGLRPGRDARLENANSIAEALATLAARAAEVTPGEWITSIGGFSRNQFFPAPEPTRFPTLEELTRAVPNNPVFIMEGFSGPGATNALGKAFLEAHGIAVAPDGFVVGGSLFGATPCTQALFLLRQMQTRETMMRGLEDALAYAAGVGVTTHLDQGGFPSSGSAADGAAHFDRYRAHDSVRALWRQGKLINRIWINFLHLEEDPLTPELMARLLNSWNHFGDDMLRAVGIGEFTAGPFFAPGNAAWQHGTRLVADAGWRNENHSLNLPVGGVPDWKVIIDGWQGVHDERIAGGHPEGIQNLRWVLAHVPVITSEYVDKLKNLGGGISVLGGWRWLSGTPTANGPPFRTIVESGIPTGMSSDGMQISTLSPWINLHYVVTGKNARGVAINAGQTLDRRRAMRLYTADNGWFLRAEDKLGTIEQGKLADLVVLSADYFDSTAVPDERIKDLRSVLTIVNGKVVWNDLDGTQTRYWKAGLP